MRTVFFFLAAFCFGGLQASTTATTENEPSALVNGVNVITGDLYLMEEDVVVQGVEPIHLQRNYISQKGKGYWNMFPYHRAFIEFYSKTIEVVEPSGARLFYQWKEKYRKDKLRRTFYSIDPTEENSKGLTNMARGKPSGKTNLKNQNIDMSKDGGQFSVLCPDGTKRFYQKYDDVAKNFAVEEFMDWNVSSFSDSTSYLLVKEELPNGREIRYEWPKKKTDTWQIKTCDSSQKTTYSWIKFYPHNGKGDKSHGDYGVETSDGRHFEYQFFTYNKVHQLKKVESSENPDKTYQYHSYGKTKLLKNILLPEGRFSYFNYYVPGELSEGENNPVCFRVKEIIAPVGENQAPMVTHRFVYDIPNKKTTVFDAYSNPTEYFWNDDLRLVQINRFKEPGVLKNQEKFIWGENDSKDVSNLLCKVTFDENEKPLMATRYVYDEFGNALKETFYGNLTGKGQSFELDESGFPIEENSENYSKECTYSDDGKNLLLSQREENGLSISYTYFKSTPLIETETYYAHGIPQKRKTFEYESNGILYKEITEDLVGNFYKVLNLVNKKAHSPHERGLTYEYPKFPMVFDENYGRGNASQHLTTTAVHYTKGGKILTKEVFDANGNRGDSSSYYYEKGCLVSETNALNYQALSTYDNLSNLKTYSDFEGRSTLFIEYDLANRPVLTREEGESLERTHRCKYNALGHKIESYDPYEHKTSYEYDPFGNLLKTILPSKGVIVSEYDALGNMISQTDAKGITTRTVYNAYQKPTLIFYPNGCSEQFIYNKDGTLQKHIDQEGMKTSYTYDVFGRVLIKIASESQESKTYDSFNVLTETDAEGEVTVYAYDAAGRKTSEKRGEEELCYSYDPMGRLHRTTSGKLSLLKFYNELNQVIEEKKVGDSDQVLQAVTYGYYPSGNLHYTEKSISGKIARETLEYDDFKRLIKQTNAEGYVTRTHYDDGAHKESNIDPLGLQVVRRFNENNQVISLERYSPKGVFLLQEIYTYDLNLNLEQKDTITLDLSTSTRWEYNEMNQVVLLIEGYESSDAKTTTYSYTSKGQLYQTTKSSGVILTNTYTVFGDLESQGSSDGSIRYSYIHDLNGQLRQSTDEITGATLYRSYTSEGRLLEETLPTGLHFKNTYDSMGRRRLFELPDASEILYHYGALYLERVSKLVNGRPSYTHTYLKYDLSGNLLSEVSFGSLLTKYDYDVLGRRTLIQSNYFSEEATSFDPAGNLLAKTRNGHHFTYSYDPLYQLVSEKDHTYKFDALHNRLRKDKESFTANALHQTSQLPYNADGNPSFWKGKKLSYDALDRLIQVEDSEQKVLYTYDSLHRRISKKIYIEEVLTTDVSYLYDDQNEIGAFDNLLQEVIELRILGNSPNAEIGASIAIEIDRVPYMPVHDLHGNVAALINHTGLVENYSYTAFGEEDPSEFNPWRFSSKRTDPETGFVYFGRRYYIPELGRFLTPDPLGLAAGPNRYAYVSNSPLIHFDLYGLFESGFNIEDQKLRNDNPASTLGRFYQEFYDNHKTSTYTVGSVDAPNCYVSYINGMITKKSEAMEYAKRLSDMGGGIKVHGVYNPADPASAFLGFFFPRPATKLLREQCDRFIALDPKGAQKTIVFGHSDGNTHIQHCLKGMHWEEQQRIISVAIAPATVISREICYDSLNLAIQGDPVPHIRHIGAQLCFRPGFRQQFSYSVKHFNELQFLEPHPNSKFPHHSFDDPTFEVPIKSRLLKYIEVSRGVK